MAAALLRMCGAKLPPPTTGALTASPPLATSPTRSKAAALKVVKVPGAEKSSTSAPPVLLKKTSRSG